MSRILALLLIILSISTAQADGGSGRDQAAAVGMQPPPLLAEIANVGAPMELAAWLGCAAFIVGLANQLIKLTASIRGDTGNVSDLWKVMNGLRVAISRIETQFAASDATRVANAELLGEVSEESKQTSQDVAVVKALLEQHMRDCHK